MNSVLILDTETTGLMLPGNAANEKQPHIIEIGAIIVNGELKIIDTLSVLCNPGFTITSEIEKITGIKNSDLETAKSESEALDDFLQFVKKYDYQSTTAHNAEFDIQILQIALKRHNKPAFDPKQIFCTATESEHLFGYTPSLSELYEKVTGTNANQEHRALADCRLIYEILIFDLFGKAFDMYQKAHDTLNEMSET